MPGSSFERKLPEINQCYTAEKHTAGKTPLATVTNTKAGILVSTAGICVGLPTGGPLENEAKMEMAHGGRNNPVHSSSHRGLYRSGIDSPRVLAVWGLSEEKSSACMSVFVPWAGEALCHGGSRRMIVHDLCKVLCSPQFCARIVAGRSRAGRRLGRSRAPINVQGVRLQPSRNVLTRMDSGHGDFRTMTDEMSLVLRVSRPTSPVPPSHTQHENTNTRTRHKTNPLTNKQEGKLESNAMHFPQAHYQ